MPITAEQRQPERAAPAPVQRRPQTETYRVIHRCGHARRVEFGMLYSGTRIAFELGQMQQTPCLDCCWAMHPDRRVSHAGE